MPSAPHEAAAGGGRGYDRGVTGELETVVVDGAARDLAAGTGVQPARFELRTSDLSVALAGAAPITAAYRDLDTVAVDQGRLLLVLGQGSLRLLGEQLGQGLGALVRELRERRARQQLEDRLIDLPQGERLELVEYRSGDEHGVAQLAYHPWGVALLPLDERRPWRQLRRADIDTVRAEPATGSVSVVARGASFELLGLGFDHERHRARLDGLRQSALADAGAIVARLMPGAPFDARTRAGALLVDGRPVSAAEMGDGWSTVERAVLADPTYAQTYAALRERAGAGEAWLSLAPVRPSDASEHMSWFFVALPNDLVAFELVSEGSHATYLFRAGGAPQAAVREVSECLIDIRFLREPIYMTDEQLAAPENLRYRFAIAALPSLRAARERFAGRLIHNDEESWQAALDQAITSGGS